MRDPHLIRVEALRHATRACEVCVAENPATAPHGYHWKAAGVKRRPKDWFSRGKAYHHPSPYRSAFVLWRCAKHATVGQVATDQKVGLGGGVYR